MRVLFLLGLLASFEALLCDEGAGDQEKCGGIFSGLQYSIVSPNYPKEYPTNQDCVYTLKGSPSAKCDQEFHLQFLDFNLPASEGCDKDYLKIGSGSVYCGSNVGTRKFKGQNKSLEVIFHSDAKTTNAKGFKILVTTLTCGDSQANQIRDGPIPTLNNDSARESEKNSTSLGPDVADNGRGDQAPSRLGNIISQVKNLSEHLELPEFEQHDFHDENCGHTHAVNDDGIGSITSYLYLPPADRTGPLKNSGENIAAEIIPNQIVIRHFGDQAVEDVDVAERPADLILPSRKIPPQFGGRTGSQFQPFRSDQRMSQFNGLSNRWHTYGVPNSPSPYNPNIPTNNFDPFSNNNNNNNYPGVNFNPVSPNCGRDPNTPNYYPDDSNNNNGNWKPNVNPVGYPESGVNFDTGIGFNANNDPNYFVNYYPNNNNNNDENNNFYGSVDDTTYYGSGLSQCCSGSSYSSQSFLITNPGFPALIYSSSSYECQYTIQRASSNICQLQMYLKFFNFGSDDQFCAYGYVDIDGQRICGCKTGANITASFDNIATKTITVKYLGYPKVKFSGFVIEVNQVSCSTNYLRFRNYQRRNPTVIRNYVDGVGNTFRGKRDLGYSYQRPNSAALTTTGQNLFLGSCQIFKFLNWVKAAKQVYLRSAQCSSGTSITGVSSSVSVIPVFPDTGNAAIINYPPSSNCETINVVEGTISSSYYPSNYSNNLNQCYRFFKAPGYCQLELAILDFDLENSTFCRKDYVSFSGQKRRYCGTSLAGSRTIFDMARANFADLYFVTDSSGTGRGFRAGFTQISC